MALRPPVSAISGTSGRRSSSSRVRAIRRALAVEPVKATPATRGSATRAAPTFGPPGSKVQHVGRRPGLQRQTNGCGGDQRRLRRRLGDDRVAGRQRRGDLAEEDGQRKVPRADAGEDAAAAQGQLVELSGRPWQPFRQGGATRLDGVVAAEVDRLAHLAQGVGQGLAGLAHQQRHERGAIPFDQVAQAFEDRRPRAYARQVPLCLGAGGRSNDLVHLLGESPPPRRRARLRRPDSRRPSSQPRLARRPSGDWPATVWRARRASPRAERRRRSRRKGPDPRSCVGSGHRDHWDGRWPGAG